MIGAESIRIALQGLLANRLRSALTMLGILIGVGSVILLVAVGNGSSKAVQRQIENLGTNTLVVFRQGPFGRGGGQRLGTSSRRSVLTMNDVRALENKQLVPDVKEVAPSISAQQVTASYETGSTYSPQQFTGTTANYAQIRNYEIAAGRFLNDEDTRLHAKVAVLGQTVMRNLFGAADPIGARVKFNRATFQIIGVLESKGSSGAQDQDDVVLAPITAVQDELTGNTGQLNSISIQAVDRKHMDAAAEEITAALLASHKITNAAQADFNVLNQGTLLETSNATGRVFTVLLGAVAAISLLVGGIGVMNIMLVTVTERTREIGIRKAIGARKADILGQFLVEAVLLSVLGGIVGVAAGLSGSQFKVVGIQPAVQPYSVALAFAVAVIVGLFFGLYPANRAASLRPIEALRYE
jgi:putative ABC transport system permease protein